MERVTGIGGVFFRARDRAALLACWTAPPSCSTTGSGNLDRMVEQLRRGRRAGDDRIEETKYGRFAGVTDSEGN